MGASITNVERKVSSLNAPALKYNIPEQTLIRYYKKRVRPLGGDGIDVVSKRIHT